jgi:ABC-type multidrug transport system ATPase subunit
MTHAPELLVGNGLCKSFAGRGVLGDVSCTLRAGEIVMLIGANGAGKTTLLHCLAGLTRPDRGTVHWCGQSSQRHVTDRRLVGMVFHEHQLYPHLTMRENLIFAARMYQVVDPVRHVQSLLVCRHLLADSHRTLQQLSQGLRQRYAIVRALIHEPPIILLDEPFVNLDPPGRQWLSEWLQGLRCQGHGIYCASHETSLSNCADRVLRLEGGRLTSIDASGAGEATADSQSVAA